MNTIVVHHESTTKGEESKLNTKEEGMLSGFLQGLAIRPKGPGPRYSKDQVEKMKDHHDKVTTKPKLDGQCAIFASEFGRTKAQIYHWFEEHRRKLRNEAKKQAQKDRPAERDTFLHANSRIHKKLRKPLTSGERKSLLEGKDRAERQLKRIPIQLKELRKSLEEWNVELFLIEEALEEGTMEEE